MKNKNKFKSMKISLPETFENTEVEKEVKNHYPIKLEFVTSFKLFCMNRLIIVKKCLNKPIHKKMTKLYADGQSRLENDFSLEKLIKNVRGMKYFINK